MSRDVDLWTDGSGTAGGPGGWAFVLRYGDIERVGVGHAYETTSQRMELIALLMGLRALKRPVVVTVHTDSAYMMNAWVEGWLKKWKRNGWVTSRKRTAVANKDIWLALLEATELHSLRWVKIAGHTGVELNERCDVLAGDARLNPDLYVPVPLPSVQAEMSLV